MSSKIKKWNFRKLFISNGVGCRGCSKPNLSKTNSESQVSTYPKIGDTFVVIKNLDDPFQDNHTSTPFSIINIDSLSPPSIAKNDVTDLSETNSESKVSTHSRIGKNLDDSFQDNYHTSTTFSIKTIAISTKFGSK
ncbi:hypothetical protein R3W88_000487 [Solanum pinnatisectum]|uniref:Uncharacterized protein n=1 Tax=Solanum pinnatisectum TaxID=50273 RepID=A0AAV9MIS2_9SOLN|nr:hypothetical protein R3W88_000487 [Solanum pinnatisectum]